MSTEQFIASLVSSLAWPAVVVAIAVMFRDQLRRLLSGQLRRLEAGPSGIKAEFAEFDRIASHVQAELPAASVPSVASPLAHELRALADDSPRGAIIEAHGRIQRVLRDGLNAVGEPVGDSDTTIELAERAAARSLITPETLRGVEGISVMRNLALHDPSGQLSGLPWV